MKYPYRKARPYSYGNYRPLSSVRYIVIHYTGNNGDTAKNNVDYFATGNTRYAGAHYFVDQRGSVWQSVPMDLTAWSVGDRGAGPLKGKCTNSNSVSIELCDCATKDPSDEMIRAVKGLLKYIQAKCPNAKHLCRHYDVTHKSCPARFTDETAKGSQRWAKFLKDIGHASKPYPTQNLYYGYEGEQVKRLQRCLNKIDHAHLTVDGSFGPATSKAVKHFKKKHMGNNAPTDKVGPKTRARIKELLK